MVFPLVAAAAGHALRFGLTSSSLRIAGGTFAQALPFGAGYSFGTYLGFPGNYKKRSGSRSFKTKPNVINNMPYGSGYGRSRYSYRSRYNRYPSRRRYSRYAPRRSYRRYY